MYLFSRRARVLGGDVREAISWIAAVTEKANQVTGLEFRAWSQVYSPQFGSIVWSTFLPDLATIEAASDKLQVDDGFLDLLDRGAKVAPGGYDDGLAQIIHGDPDAGMPAEYVTTVRAACAPGMIARGLELGVELAQDAERITGRPTLFAAGATGVYGQVSWFTAHANVGELEAAQMALQSDPDWLAKVDREASKAYTDDPFITQQLIFRRIS